MGFNLSWTGLAGSVLGIIAGLVILGFDVSRLTVAGSEDAAVTMGVITIGLGVVGLIMAFLSESSPRFARMAFLVLGIAGFLVAAMLWIPAGLLMLFEGLSGLFVQEDQ